MGINDFLKSSGVSGFIKKQFIDVLQYVENEDGVLSYRFPMADMEIQNGASLTVRESQMAAFVNEGRMADIFSAGTYKVSTQNVPLLTNLMNWDKMFESPFKSDVYFFSTRQQLNQKWGTPNPITIRDKEFGAVRVRGNGVYAWHLADPRTFHLKVSGTREVYRAAELEGQLRDIVISRMADAFAQSGIPFLDMIANQVELGAQIFAALQPSFNDLGLQLDTFVVRELAPYAPRRAAEAPRRAHLDEHDWRHGPLYPVPGRAVDPHRRRQRRGHRWYRRRPQRWLRHGPSDDRRHATGLSAAPATAGPAPRCRPGRRPRLPARRNEVLFQLRLQNPSRREILRRVWIPSTCGIVSGYDRFRMRMGH